MSLPVSTGLQARLIHTPVLILRYPKSTREKISILSNLTKDLQLKWSSRGLEGEGGVTEVLQIRLYSF
jgi:hypothetical protein